MRTLRPIGALIGASAAAVAILALLLAATGYDATAALYALWRGSFGSAAVFASSTLVRATPLILTGLAVAIAFRAGVLNIGAEGQFLAGATAATWLGLDLGPAHPSILALPLVLIVGAVAGGVWAGIAGWLRRQFGVLEVISTIMLNFLAQYGVAYLVRGPLQEPTHIYPQTATLSDALHLPWLIPGTRLHAGFALAVVAAIGAAWVLRGTASGFRLRASGSNPYAAASVGLIDVESTTSSAFVISGALAGLAGAVEVTGVTYALYENISPGYGYTAIAVALLAGLDPAFVIVAGILFGALDAGAGAMQRDAGVPSVMVTVVEAVLILIFLIPRVRAIPGAARITA
jgi:general nucleoside transport system permease protein